MSIREEENILYGLLDKRSEEDLKIQRTSNYFYNLSKKGIGTLNNNDNKNEEVNIIHNNTFVSKNETIINNTFINVNVTVQNFY